MGCPRPSYGRVKNYTTQGRFGYGCLGGPQLGINQLFILSLHLLQVSKVQQGLQSKGVHCNIWLLDVNTPE